MNYEEKEKMRFRLFLMFLNNQGRHPRETLLNKVRRLLGMKHKRWHDYNIVESANIAIEATDWFEAIVKQHEEQKP